jgi:hypothetical protein
LYHTQGKPVFEKETNECQHQFVWSSSAACPHAAHKSVPQGACMIEDVARHADYDLSPLAVLAGTAGAFQVTVCSY